MVSASAIDGAFERKIPRIEEVRASRGITLVSSNEDTYHIIRIIKSLKNSSVLIDEVSKKCK